MQKMLLKMGLEFVFVIKIGKVNHVILIPIPDHVILSASTALVRVPESAFSALNMHIGMQQDYVYAKTTE